MTRWGYVQTNWQMKGIEYALSKGAIISNHSYGGSMVDTATKTNYNNLAYNNPNHLFIYAAGNSNKVIDSSYPEFGCALEMITQICVAASTYKSEKAYFSNTGKQMVHVFAPGDSIESTTYYWYPDDDDYRKYSLTQK